MFATYLFNLSLINYFHNITWDVFSNFFNIYYLLYENIRTAKDYSQLKHWFDRRLKKIRSCYCYIIDVVYQVTRIKNYYLQTKVLRASKFLRHSKYILNSNPPSYPIDLNFDSQLALDFLIVLELNLKIFRMSDKHLRTDGNKINKK